MKMYKTKGGEFRYSLMGVVDNDTFVVPAGCKIDSIIAGPTGGNGITVSIGTADDGTQIVNAGSAAAGAPTALTVATSVFSTAADQTCHITAVPGAGEVLNLYVQMSHFVVVA